MCIRDSYRRATAGILASGLTEGVPCPVCGSLTHPAPAKLSGGTPDEKAVQALKAAYEKARAVSYTHLDVYKRQPIGWTEEKLTVTPMEERTCHYFIRFAGDAGERRQEIEASFGPVEIISIDGMDEFAVLTGPMKEGKYAKISAAFDGIRQRIRAELAR